MLRFFQKLGYEDFVRLGEAREVTGFRLRTKQGVTGLGYEHLGRLQFVVDKIVGLNALLFGESHQKCTRPTHNHFKF